MDTTKAHKVCSCKGIRSCLLCEPKNQTIDLNDNTKKVYQYCHICKSAWQHGNHPDHLGSPMEFRGIYLHEEFISVTQEEQLLSEIDKTPYVSSQSGRRKQDYGPKVNFKKKKVKCDVFTGLPSYSQALYQQLVSLPVMTNFVPVELCNLEYVPERGSAIDPHFDDFWLWGDRLVTVNLLSDTILYFTHEEYHDIEIHVPLNRRSLVVVSGNARTEWKHGIHRTDITDRRVAMTFRELSKEFEPEGKNSEAGRKLKEIALTFSGIAVGVHPES